MAGCSEQLVLGAEPDAAARARRFVTERLTGQVPPDLVDDARLVVTELVTNAQLHGTPPVVVRLGALDGGVRLEVEDASRDLPLLPASSLDAMTGRGLALVGALASAWGVAPDPLHGKAIWAELRVGGDVAEVPDLDALLDSWGDEEAGEPLHRVRIGSVPTRLLLDAKRHIDNVVRELTLQQAGEGQDPPGFAALVRAVTEDFALARAGIKRQAADAAARGDAETELVLTLPASAVSGGQRYLEALEETDRYARDARLLTLETPALHKLFRRWYVRAVVEQLRALSRGEAPPEPLPFVEVLAEEVSVLSSLRDASHRLDVLQQVNADLAAARTAEEMADVVLRTCVEELEAVSARAYVVDGNVLRTVGVGGPDAMDAAVHHEVPLAADLPGPVALRTGRPVVLRDVAHAEERFPAMRGSVTEDRCLHVVPLLVGTRRTGVLAIGLPPDSRVPHDERGAFVQALADALAQALDRVHVVEPGASAQGLDHAHLFRTLPTAYVVMDRDLVLVDANDAYLATVGRTREDILGRWVFDAFPPTADALEEGTDVSRVQRSFERARDTGQVDVLPVQKYDIPDPVGGGMVERYWSLISVPVEGPDGRVAYVAQRAEDITDFVRERERGQRAEHDSEQWRRRAQEVEADLYARGTELAAAVAARDRAARRLADLAGVALALTGAEDLDDLGRLVFEDGVAVLGADGGALALLDPEGDGGSGVLRVRVSASISEQVVQSFGTIAMDSPMAAAVVARTGRARLIPDPSEAGTPEDAEAMRLAGRRAAAVLPLRVEDRLLGSLSVSWREERRFDADDVELLDGLAAQVAQAVDRIRATEAQRRAAVRAERMSEALQRSLLSDPPVLDGLSLAVRYRPAAAQAHVGGDWYDAFVPCCGGVVLAIGDVTGHDRVAAAAMGQLRNLLRGLAVDSEDGPARLLTRLDTAVQGLDLGVLATAVLARLEPGPRLRWSSAGHLPPLLRAPDGAVRRLEVAGDLMLGVDPTSPRTEHLVDLPPGSTLVLCTDGLVERRGSDLDTGLDALAARLVGLDGDVESTADALLALVDEGSNVDDIALLVLRVEG